MKKLYYTAPQDKCFEEVKKEAIALWTMVGDEPSYAEDKISRIKDIGNIKDNFMSMVAMFDSNNQQKLADKLSPETRQEIRARMIDVGSAEWDIPF